MTNLEKLKTLNKEETRSFLTKLVESGDSVFDNWYCSEKCPNRGTEKCDSERPECCKDLREMVEIFLDSEVDERFFE